MTFDLIYQSIQDKFAELSGQEVNDDSDLGIRMKIIAGEMKQLYDEVDFCAKQIFPQTATGIYLERHGACRDLHKKPANAAGGVLRFSRTTAALQNIVIPEGTLCSSSDGGGMTYVTDTDAVLPAGSTYVDVNAHASELGAAGNILAGKIDTVVSTIAGINAVTNPDHFSGGMEEENDEVFRSRLLKSFLQVSNGANMTFYEDFAMRHHSVTSAKAVFSTSVSNQLDLYITDYFRLTSQSIVQSIQNDINTARELNINVKVQAATAVAKNVSVVIYVRSMQNSSAKSAQANSLIRQYLYERAVGEALNPYALASEISSKIDGVVSIAFTQPTVISPVLSNQVIKPGTVSVDIRTS